MVISVVILLLLFFNCFAEEEKGVDAFPSNVPPRTVEEVNVTRYLGRWYQMYASLIPNTTFERDGYCVFAQYRPTNVSDAVFAITNVQRVGSPTGRLEKVEGIAKQGAAPGKFTIQFNSMNTNGDYWIVALGDVPSGKDQYPWAVVSVPYGTSLFILARDVEEFRALYEDEVLALVRERGFRFFWNRPLETYQGSDCIYTVRKRRNLRGDV